MMIFRLDGFPDDSPSKSRYDSYRERCNNKTGPSRKSGSDLDSVLVCKVAVDQCGWSRMGRFNCKHRRLYYNALRQCGGLFCQRGLTSVL